MNSDNTQVESNQSPESKCRFGEQFKTARENMGLSAEEAAQRLHLSPRFIHLLENEGLLRSTLPPTYLRGYLRSYSRLLHIPEADVVAILEQLAPTPAVLTSPSASSLALSFPLEANPYYTRFATVVVFLVLLTSVTTWWYLHTNTGAPTIIASSQTLAPEQNSGNESLAYADSLNEVKNPVLSAAENPGTNTVTAAKIQTNPAPAPSSLELALASPAGETPGNLAAASAKSSPAEPAPAEPTIAKPQAKHLEQDEGDDNTDDQE